MAERVTRVISPAVKKPSVIDGSTRCESALPNVAHCPASAASTVIRPVTRGGGIMPGSSRPGPATTPRRE